MTARQGTCVTRHTAVTHGIPSIGDLEDPAIIAVLDRDGDGQPHVRIGAPGWTSTAIERIRAKSYGSDQVWARRNTTAPSTGAHGTAPAKDEPWMGFRYEPCVILRGRRSRLPGRARARPVDPNDPSADRGHAMAEDVRGLDGP